MPAFGCKETPENGLVSGYPSPRPLFKSPQRPKSFTIFNGGLEAYRGTGAIGKKVATQVLLLESNSKAFWKGRFKFDGDIFSQNLFQSFLSNRWRYVKKMRNFMEFATISISKLRPVLPVDWRKKRHVDHHSLTSCGGTAPHCQRSQGVSWQKLRRKWRFQICYNDYFKVSSNKLKSKATNNMLTHCSSIFKSGWSCFIHSQDSKTMK